MLSMFLDNRMYLDSSVDHLYTLLNDVSIYSVLALPAAGKVSNDLYSSTFSNAESRPSISTISCLCSAGVYSTGLSIISDHVVVPGGPLILPILFHSPAIFCTDYNCHHLY